MFYAVPCLYLLCKYLSTALCTGEIYTPFMIAVRNGHTQLVTLLLERFDIDVSAHLGTLKFDGYLIEGELIHIIFPCNTVALLIAGLIDYLLLKLPFYLCW